MSPIQNHSQALFFLLTLSFKKGTLPDLKQVQTILNTKPPTIITQFLSFSINFRQLSMRKRRAKKLANINSEFSSKLPDHLQISRTA